MWPYAGGVIFATEPLSFIALGQSRAADPRPQRRSVGHGPGPMSDVILRAGCCRPVLMRLGCGMAVASRVLL
jgi:hypothetical protein